MGACLRYLATLVTTEGLGESFPFGTLGVNLLGCLLIGVAAGALPDGSGSRTTIRLFLVVGLLGGFTTFSSFGLETMRLLEEGRLLAAVTYITASNAGGLLLCYLGLRGAGLFNR